MGYITLVTGELRITPPLTWPEIRASEYAPGEPHRHDLVLLVREETVQTEEGPLLRRTAHALALRPIEEYRAYTLVKDVQAAIDAHPGHTFTGYLSCEGEETGDLWRVVIKDGRAVEVRPRIVWPDEEESLA
ncbi:DUF6205 family protein [Streptomyces sp. SPB074]|uniref:DUF6205 family protein n=1 Tax=Streptomyces sp. (strain SPB074) TaxID=465543 RepID=UPI00017F0E5C|nr:DUF6205 family protein [Streptomyces sp. SPB074]